MSEVAVTDVRPPATPESPIDSLIDYLSERFPRRKRELREIAGRAKLLTNKSDVVELGYEIIDFRLELDEWLFFAKQLLDEEHGNQLQIAHDEQAKEASERGSKRPNASLVKGEAEQHTAALRRAVGELGATREWMTNMLSWCQSQQKLIREEEYSSSFESKNITPEAKPDDDKAHPPSLAEALKR